jgi:heavy metal sensor kinase
MKFFPQSIRWRVQLWYALLLAVIVSSLLVAFYRNQREIKFQAIDRELSDPITRVLPLIDKRPQPPPRNRRLPRPGPGLGPDFGPDDDFDRPQPRRDEREEREEELERITTGLAERDIYVIHWNRRGEISYISTNGPDQDRVRPEVDFKDSDEIIKKTLNGFREVIHTGAPGGVLVLGKSIRPLEKELSSLALRLVAVGSAIVGGGFLVGWFLIGRSLKPIAKISGTAHRIASGNLADRIPVKNTGSELGQLSGILNETFERLERSFEHQVRFTADASHEMRTPISVILAKSQFALNRERSPEKYQECLRTCLESAQHMRSLTDALLELSKVDSGEFILRTDEANLADLTREVMRMIEPLAEEKKVTIDCSLEDLTMAYDEQKIRQALLNLLGNAVKYNREGGSIEVSLKRSGQQVDLTVADTGPGIAPENLPHLFERFYRVDRARKRAGRGGTGLGLAITKAIVAGHGGSISVASELEKGTRFEISLPVGERPKASG